MGISFDRDQIAIKDGTPYIIPRDANFDTFSLLGGFDADNEFKFGKFSSEGKLLVDASVSPGLLKVLDIDSEEMILSGGVNPDTETNFLYCQDQRMTFSGGHLNVNADIGSIALPPNAATETTLVDILEALGGSSSVSKQSFYGEAEVAPGNTPVTIVEYTVDVGTRFRIDSVRGWSNVDAEFLVTINSAMVDGYRTTPANLTMSIESEYIQYATAGQVIRIEASHTKKSGDRLIKAVLQGAIETI